ncbi:hypothetical protein QYE76_050570 [Lolium multiflorum]|uniref:Transposase (putative) gypsy type domain-containing protein n=1 Tax=Lolium multiflorum TaxID=4521 RepID=A0AAD8WHY3_LOLMU|nr:hypothetical protein QYE76_050570 [Lolium multiflorum]
MGFTKKENALRFPHEESYPSPPMEYRVSFVDHLIRGLSPPIHEFLRGLLFVYGLQLHQLTPNSILHVSIFIMLCECFLGVHPNWAWWKRIFCLRRNGSHGVAYNIGGVVICVRSDVDYFDVKFPDSVQGWRKKWLYVYEESSDSVEYNIAPFDGKTKILRRRSWDAEATEEEKLATEALMTRIRELQNTRGKELSGIQITAYFLRIRVQPLQARKNPLWTYAGDEDVERLSKGLPVKDLEKLIRRISKLNKKETIPSSCQVKPFCSANPLPEGHLVLSSLPPLPEGGEVEERAVVTDDNQGTSRPESEVAGSQKSAASLEKENETEATSSTRSSLPASPRAKGKGMRLLIPAPPKPVLHVPEDLHLVLERGPSILTKLLSSARRTNREYELENPEGDQLLDALSLLEIHGDEARDGLSEAKIGLSRLFPYFFKKKEEPATFVALAKCFTSQENLGLQLRQEGLKVGVEDVGQIVPKCLAKMAKRKKNFSKYDDVVTPVAEDMMDELLRMDAEFFVKGSYAEHSTRAINNERLTIDNILGNP